MSRFANHLASARHLLVRARVLARYLQQEHWLPELLLFRLAVQTHLLALCHSRERQFHLVQEWRHLLKQYRFPA